MTWIRCILLFIALLFVTGCAAVLEKPIDVPIEKNPTEYEVRMNIDTYIGRQVRWGGVIANVNNDKDSSLVEIVSRPLDGTGRPVDTDQTKGRFLARIKGFIDPVVFAKGRELTVVGVINRKTKRLIDMYEYLYPEVDVEFFKLWAPREEKNLDYYPFWYDPWYRRFPGPPGYPWYYY